MKKSDFHHPIYGERSRPARRVSVGELQWRNDSVHVKGGYSLSLNDSIVFPDRIEDFEIFLQPVAFNSDLYQTHISVLKNGKPAYVSLGCLFRQDAFSRYTCEFGRRLSKMSDDLERVLLLVGNRIRCDKTKEVVFWKRNPDNGRVILPRETFTTKFPVVKYDGVNAAAVTALLDSRLLKGRGDLALAYPDVEVDEDGFWPFGRPIRRLYKAAINGMVHIMLDATLFGEEMPHDLRIPTISDLRKLVDSSATNTPIDLIHHRPHLHNVAVCPIRDIIVEDNEIRFEQAASILEVDERQIIVGV